MIATCIIRVNLESATFSQWTLSQRTFSQQILSQRTFSHYLQGLHVAYYYLYLCIITEKTVYIINIQIVQKQQ